MLKLVRFLGAITFFVDLFLIKIKSWHGPISSFFVNENLFGPVINYFRNNKNHILKFLHYNKEWFIRRECSLNYTKTDRQSKSYNSFTYSISIWVVIIFALSFQLLVRRIFLVNTCIGRFNQPCSFLKQIFKYYPPINNMELLYNEDTNKTQSQRDLSEQRSRHIFILLILDKPCMILNK